MKKPKPPKVQYSGLLDKPYSEREPREGTPAHKQWIQRVIAPRWSALFEHYGIDQSAPGAHYRLIEALAADHVPGFRPAVPGAPTKRNTDEGERARARLLEVYCREQERRRRLGESASMEAICTSKLPKDFPEEYRKLLRTSLRDAIKLAKLESDNRKEKDAKSRERGAKVLEMLRRGHLRMPVPPARLQGGPSALESIYSGSHQLGVPRLRRLRKIPT